MEIVPPPPMPEPPPTPPVALEPLRKRVIQELCEHFAADHITDAELEGRLDRAHGAASLEELRGVLVGLPALPRAGEAVVPAAGKAPELAPAGTVPERQVIAAIMGGATRKGPWTPPRQLHVFAVMGGAELDFRQARFGPGVTEVTIFTMMGGVEITVPPGLHVEANGMGIMGGFDHGGTSAEPVSADPNAPVLRINGVAILGGVEVSTRLPGESKGDARRRERLHRKEMRRLHKGG